MAHGLYSHSSASIMEQVSDSSYHELSTCWDGRPCQGKGGRKVGAAVPLSVAELGPYLKQCRMGRCLPSYQVALWSI